MNKCGCTVNYSKVLCTIKELLAGGKDSELALLCDPDGVPVIVKYAFKEFASDTLPIPVSAYNVDGTAYSGDIALLVACSGGGGGSSGIGVLEYFICDDGNQKIVRLCGTACGSLTTTYYLLNGTPSTEPESWSLVTAGPCPDFVTNGVLDVTRLTATGAGNIAGGAYSVSILNTGGATGQVLGEDIVEGQSINLTAIYDNFNNVFKYLPAIDYDGSGTTLSITVVA